MVKYFSNIIFNSLIDLFVIRVKNDAGRARAFDDLVGKKCAECKKKSKSENNIFSNFQFVYLTQI